jgi:hypothetical protein
VKMRDHGEPAERHGDVPVQRRRGLDEAGQAAWGGLQLSA